LFVRRLKYLPNVLRLGAFCLFVSCVLLVFTMRAFAHNVNEGMLSLGAEMMRYADRQALGPVRRMEINGAQLAFATGTTSDSVTQVLDYYARRCASRSGAVSEQLAEIANRAHTSGAAVATPESAPLTTIRHGSDRQGYVACLDVGNTRLTPEEILRRVQTFARTGNLTDVGRMRYLYAERGTGGRTRFIGFWSDSEVNITRMFPTAGDAPGEDRADVPRAPGLRRLLHAYEVGQQFSMSIYAGASPREQVEQHYRAEMPRHGWTLIPMRGGTTDLRGQTMLTYEKGATTMTLIFDRTAGGQTSVTALLGM